MPDVKSKYDLIAELQRQAAVETMGEIKARRQFRWLFLILRRRGGDNLHIR